MRVSDAVELMTKAYLHRVIDSFTKDLPKGEEEKSRELTLLKRLRAKLGIRENSKRIILARLNHFPRGGNRIHTPSEFRDVLLDLQRRGVLFYCNKMNGGTYVLPDEIVAGVKSAMGIELSKEAWFALLGQLSRTVLSDILDNAGLPKSGNKDALRDRIIDAGIPPSLALEGLSTRDLYEVLDSLPGAKVSGSKQDRIDRIIEYFANLVLRDVPAEAEPEVRFYRYLVELASRDRENLLANKVIKKDIEIDRAFEEGTRYLFGTKLGLELIHMEGSDHPDGCFEIGRHGDVLMWDNKSKESVYEFPASHLRQFKRYIRDSERRVSCFLVIVPSIGSGAAQAAARLKIESGTDTDVSIITAEDLVWVSEEWGRRARNKPFNPEVFNVTGILDRQVVESRMSLFS